jgi:methyl-accepting chemotaxis protein
VENATMNTRARRGLAVLVLSSLALLPARGLSQARAPVSIPDGLPAQDKEMLALALEASKRSGEILEKWIAAKEVSEERLFSFLYYPVPKTDPPKFTTDWDRLSDRDILPVEEGALSKSAAMSYAVLVDRFGYLPTHNQRYSQPITGNPALDLVNNRTKRIFNDRTGLLAARSQAPFLFQRYQRDTGESMVDLSVPVYVKGQHWGALRLGYRQVEGR